MRLPPIVTLAALGLTLGACQALDITNNNQPDRGRALANANDVESLIAGGYATIFRVTQLYDPAHALSMAADEGTSSYGNWAWQDISSEPRAPWNNDASYNYNDANRVPWSNLYAAITGVNEGIRAIEDGLEIGEDGERNARALAFGRFQQGVAYGLLGLVFDQAAIVDENTDPDAGLVEASPHPEVIAAAIGFLDESIAIASENDFVLEKSWVSLTGFDQDDLIKLANSYKARFLVYGARTLAENEATDWAEVKTLIEAGITEDFAPVGNDEPFWTGMKYYLGLASWTRADNNLHGPADTSGAYQAWLATPLLDRTAFVNRTPDERMPAGTSVLSSATIDVQGKYFAYAGPAPFPADRGTYHHSLYAYIRDSGEGFRGNPSWYYLDPIPVMRMSEMDLLLAEAEMKLGNDLAAVALINKTRVANGGLAPATVLGAPGPQDGPGECVPKKIRDPQGACANLMNVLMFEKRMENYALDAGISFFDARRWQILPENTLLHFPIPGRELEILGLPLYTFGGGGEGSAPAPIIH